MVKRGVKRKASEDGVAGEGDDYATGWSNFQIATRRRESLRLKSQICATPGLVEKALKDKIQIEMSLIEGTAKFIMACKSQSQTLEAAKTLLVARLRSDMMKFELNKIRRGRGSPPNKQGKPSYAGTSLSDIRIPLLWRRKEHIHELGDSRRFAVFCVARIGSQIYDTSLVEPVERHCTDITLPDVLLFSKVPPYFEITLEIYSHQMEKEIGHGITATPQKIARSISRAVGRTMSKNMKDFENLGPKFELVASATLTLDQCSEGVQSHELYLDEPNPEQSEDRLPLFGQVCCRLAALPYCCEEDVICGILSLRRNGKIREMWASLIDWKLCLWKDKSNKDAARMPDLEIPVTRDTQIQDLAEDVLSVANKKLRWEFFFEEKENLHNWLVHLIQHASDHRRWKQAATQKMMVYSPQNVRNERRPFKRTRSKLVMLYNNIDASS